MILQCIVQPSNCMCQQIIGLILMLDVVVSRVDLPLLLVDVGLSDHRLLQWLAQLMRPAPVYTMTTSQPWARLDADTFRAALLASFLCQHDMWSTLDINDLAQVYDISIAIFYLCARYDVNVVHRTHGSMMNIAMPNGVFIVLSMQLRQPLQPTLLLHT